MEFIIKFAKSSLQVPIGPGTSQCTQFAGTWSVLHLKPWLDTHTHSHVYRVTNTLDGEEREICPMARDGEWNNKVVHLVRDVGRTPPKAVARHTHTQPRVPYNKYLGWGGT